jgi:hypothetical protein
MRVSLALHDGNMQRTLFHQRLVEALRRNTRFTEDEGAADVLFAAEDVAVEQHWPRYGDQAGAYVRGEFDEARYEAYVQRIAADPRRFCVVCMHPQFRLCQCLKHCARTFVADANLSTWERSLNPRTISMPALPLTTGRGRQGRRDVLASFRGVLSHPVRQALLALHDPSNGIVCEAVESANHVGRIDAVAQTVDGRYVELMERSVFALVPRGDALYSYRLTEAISFGCIPVVLSDGWVLPFDRTIDWSKVAVTLPEALAVHVPAVLRAFDRGRICEMLGNVKAVYQQHLSSLDAMMEGLLGELEMLMSRQ